MFLNNKFQIAFILVVLFASSFARFYQLGKVPNGLTVDEADMGHNAYSILKTGKDLYGKKLPIIFQSLDDYKPGLPFYASIPAIAFLGLNDVSIRISPVVLGTLIPFLIFILARKLYPDKQIFAITATVLFALAPWEIALSHAMFWYVLLIFVYLLFFIFFFESIKQNIKLLPVSSLFLGSTIYIYYAALIYLPLILTILVIIYNKVLLKNIKISFVSFILIFLIIFPALIEYLKPQTRTRFDTISVLSADVTLPLSISQLQEDQSQENFFAPIIHNRRLVYISAALDNYFDYFNFDYLFVNAKNIRYFYVNNVGLFYLVELPFFLLGLYTLAKRREKSDLLVLSLLVIGPIPAAFTLGSPFPHRGILTIFAIQLISAAGVTTLVEYVTQKRFKFKKYSFSALAILLIFYFSNVFLFLHQYFVHSKNEFTSELDNGAWFSTVRDTIPEINTLRNNYEKVVFTWSSAKLVPAVYFLFYHQIDPRIIQSKVALWTNEPPSYRQIYDKIDNIEFRPINWENDKNLKNTLFVGYPSEFPKDIKVIDKTYLPNGESHFVFVETQ